MTKQTYRYKVGAMVKISADDITTTTSKQAKRIMKECLESDLKYASDLDISDLEAKRLEPCDSDDWRP